MEEATRKANTKKELLYNYGPCMIEKVKRVYEHTKKTMACASPCVYVPKKRKEDCKRTEGQKGNSRRKAPKKQCKIALFSITL